MSKHNDIQDRIKLLMEYDTSKTYSENKELINEGLRDWFQTLIGQKMAQKLTQIVDYILKKHNIKKKPQAIQELGDKIVNNFKKRYNDPRNLEKLLDIPEDKIKVNNIKKEIDRIIKIPRLNRTSNDADILLNKTKELYSIYFTRMQKEFENYPTLVSNFKKSDLDDLIYDLKLEPNINSLEQLFLERKNHFFNAYSAVDYNLRFYYAFGLSKLISTATWLYYIVDLYLTEANLNVFSPSTKTEAIKNLCGTKVNRCNTTDYVQYNNIINILKQSANNQVRSFLLKAILYGLFKNKNKSEFYKKITICDFCKLQKIFDFTKLELTSDEIKYKVFIEAMLKSFKNRNIDMYNLIKDGFNYNKNGFTIDTSAFKQSYFVKNVANIPFPINESLHKNIIIENSRTLLNEDIKSNILKKMWTAITTKQNWVNLARLITAYRWWGYVAVSLYKLSVVNTTIAKDILRAILRLSNDYIEITNQIQITCTNKHLCKSGLSPKKYIKDLANLIKYGGNEEETVYGLILADFSKNTKEFTISDICELDRLTNNRFSIGFDNFIKDYGGRKADSLKSLSEFNNYVMSNPSKFPKDITIPKWPSDSSPENKIYSYLAWPFRKIFQYINTGGLVAKNSLGFIFIAPDLFTEKWENNCLGASDSTTPNNTNNTDDVIF